jgi:3-methyladenine DNA glycosylase AlkD
VKVSEAQERLSKLATQAPEAVAKKRGVAPESILGVSTGDIRKLAKEIGQNGELSKQLWSTEIHEAHVLAILIEPFPETSSEALRDWVNSIASWDICDLFAKRLAEKSFGIEALVQTWTRSRQLYVRRAGLALIANHCMRSESLMEREQETFCDIIERTAEDDRQHVKQACCWALRELGKISDGTHEIATTLALELCESSVQTPVWVGNCAYKELETLVKIPERRRLISRASKTAQKYFSGS